MTTTIVLEPSQIEDLIRQSGTVQGQPPGLRASPFDVPVALSLMEHPNGEYEVHIQYDDREQAGLPQFLDTETVPPLHVALGRYSGKILSVRGRPAGTTTPHEALTAMGERIGRRVSQLVRYNQAVNYQLVASLLRGRGLHPRSRVRSVRYVCSHPQAHVDRAAPRPHARQPSPAPRQRLTEALFVRRACRPAPSSRLALPWRANGIHAGKLECTRGTLPITTARTQLSSPPIGLQMNRVREGGEPIDHLGPGGRVLSGGSKRSAECPFNVTESSTDVAGQVGRTRQAAHEGFDAHLFSLRGLFRRRQSCSNACPS